MASEAGTGIPSEYRIGRAFQRSCRRFLIPPVREPQQSEDSQSTVTEHRLATGQYFGTGGIGTDTTLPRSPHTTYFNGRIRENLSGTTGFIFAETSTDRRTNQYDRIFCRSIGSISEQTELSATGEPVSEGHGKDI